MGPGLAGYIIRRLLWAVPVLFLISITVFAMLRLAPGSPIDAILGQRYTEEQAEVLRDKYGYDDPLPIQYVKYVGNLAQGDLGVSTRHRDFTASEIIWPKVWISTQIGFIALIIVFGLGIPVGIYAAMARGTFIDPLTISFWLAIEAVPTFVLATLASWFFALKLGIVDLGYEGVWSPNMIVPIMVMTLPGVAGVARFMRASVIGVLGEDYIRTARAKGVQEFSIVLHHAMRNAMVPVLTVLGPILAGLITGSFVIEQYFAIPGVGRAFVEAVGARDYGIIMGMTLLYATLIAVLNLAVDVSYAVANPRIRY